MVTVQHVLAKKGYEVHSVAPEASVFTALTRMAEHGIGSLVVIDGEDMIGIISERDYARKVILEGKSSRGTLVRDIMSSPLHSVRPTDSIEACMSLMTNEAVRHLPVKQNDKLVGLISIGDVVKAVIADQAHTITQLETYIAGRG